jgi:hypothetical protein
LILGGCDFFVAQETRSHKGGSGTEQGASLDSVHVVQRTAYRCTTYSGTVGARMERAWLFSNRLTSSSEPGRSAGGSSCSDPYQLRFECPRVRQYVFFEFSQLPIDNTALDAAAASRVLRPRTMLVDCVQQTLAYG